jgi:hypothetical protein
MVKINAGKPKMYSAEGPRKERGGEKREKRRF